MEHTKKVLEKIRETLNTHPAALAMMNMLKKEAEKNNWSDDQWEEMKVRMMSTLFYKLAMEDEEIRNELAEDIYNKLNS